MTAVITDDGFTLNRPEVLGAVHEAGPVKYDEFPFPRDCLTCLAPWPCAAEQRRRSRVRGESKVAADHARRKAAEASRAGLLALVEVGVTVWSSTHKDSVEQPRGGVIVAIDESVDTETGEYERRWTCLDWTAKPNVGVHVLNEGEVRASGVDTTDTSTMAKLLYRLAWEVWKMGRPRLTDGRIMRTSIDTKVVTHLRWMLTLAKLLMGGL